MKWIPRDVTGSHVHKFEDYKLALGNKMIILIANALLMCRMNGYVTCIRKVTFGGS